MKSKTGKQSLAKKKNWKSTLAVAAVLMSVSGAASAEGLGAILRRLTGLGQDGADAVQTFGIVIGIVLVICGILGFVADAKKDGNGPVTKKTATIMLICGCVLGALGSVLTTGSDTVWGDGGADRGRITIPN